MGAAASITSDLYPHRPGATVHVVATTTPGTRAAMREATALAQELESPVHVIVSRQVPSHWSIAEQSASARAFAREIMKLPEATSTRVKVLPCVCRRPSDVVQLLAPRAVVVIGGRSRWWWPSREQRLAKVLTTAGHKVVFVNVDPNGDHAPAGWRRVDEWERT